MNMAEDENIKMMMAESASDYDPQNYTYKPRFVPRAGSSVPQGYNCKKYDLSSPALIRFMLCP